MADASLDRYTMDRISTPIGVALFVVDGQGSLCAFDWSEFEDRLVELFRRHNVEAELVAGSSVGAARAAIERYFDGDVHAIDGVACAANGTPFQKLVWSALRRIPTGATTTYGELASLIGAPKAARAVGLANNRNPVGVIVPCHRVIGRDGSLTGYAGGLERKQWLLEHEARFAPQPLWMASTARASFTSSGESLSMRAISAR